MYMYHGIYFYTLKSCSRFKGGVGGGGGGGGGEQRWDMKVYLVRRIQEALHVFSHEKEVQSDKHVYG